MFDVDRRHVLTHVDGCWHWRGQRLTSDDDPRPTIALMASVARLIIVDWRLESGDKIVFAVKRRLGTCRKKKRR